MNEFYWMTTVRSDSIRRARQIDREQAMDIPRHLLFDSVEDAATWMEKQAGKFWPKVSNLIGRQNGASTVYIKAGKESDTSLLFGTVQRVSKYQRH